MSTTDAV
jgi:membrane-associated phospholipid phosphatase